VKGAKFSSLQSSSFEPFEERKGVGLVQLPSNRRQALSLIADLAQGCLERGKVTFGKSTTEDRDRPQRNPHPKV
jgi:hypothetical protein